MERSKEFFSAQWAQYTRAGSKPYLLAKRYLPISVVDRVRLCFEVRSRGRLPQRLELWMSTRRFSRVLSMAQRAGLTSGRKAGERKLAVEREGLHVTGIKRNGRRHMAQQGCSCTGQWYLLVPESLNTTEKTVGGSARIAFFRAKDWSPRPATSRMRTEIPGPAPRGAESTHQPFTKSNRAQTLGR